MSTLTQRLRAEHPEVASVRVFGSVARGDQTGTSDVDVLIVLRGEGTADVLEEIRRFLPYFDLPIGCDLLVLTEGQLARRLKAGDRFIQRVWNESISVAPQRRPGGASGIDRPDRRDGHNA